MPYDLIREVIVERRSLTCTYDNCVRFFSPRLLGKGPDGRELVIGFRYGGKRPGGPLPPEGAWCCFYLEALGRIRPNGDRWVAGSLGSRPAEWTMSDLEVKA